MAINQVVLVGNMTRDIELKYGQSGTAYGSFSLGVQRNFKDKSGEYETDFPNLQVFGKTAENLAQFTGKGSKIAVTGRLQTGSYVNKQGDKVYTTDVMVDSFQLLDKRQEKQEAKPASKPNPFEQSSFSLPASKNERDNENYSADDDMPF